MDERQHIGMGVMLGMLDGDDTSVNAFRRVMGKTIEDVRLRDDDALHFTFTDGAKMKLFDAGQSCCEIRYMRTDDDLTAFVGAQLMGADVRDGPTHEDEYGTHEVQFLVVTTSQGMCTMVTHNDHNGYYGGFLIRAAIED